MSAGQPKDSNHQPLRYSTPCICCLPFCLCSFFHSLVLETHIGSPVHCWCSGSFLISSSLFLVFSPQLVCVRYAHDSERHEAVETRPPSKLSVGFAGEQLANTSVPNYVWWVIIRCDPPLCHETCFTLGEFIPRRCALSPHKSLSQRRLCSSRGLTMWLNYCVCCGAKGYGCMVL